MDSQSTNKEWLTAVENIGSVSFSNIKNGAEEIVNDSQTRKTLEIKTYDLYSQQYHVNEVTVDNYREECVICADGQVRLFPLPDGSTGHLDTQGGTDRMPNIVVEYKFTSPNESE